MLYKPDVRIFSQLPLRGNSLERSAMIRTVLTAFIMFAMATVAMAHSPLQRTAPADGALIDQVPSEISFVFGRDIRLTRVEWSLDGDQTGSVNLDAANAFGTEFALPFDGAGPGAYLIEWRGLSDDGHAQKGSFAFTVE